MRRLAFLALLGCTMALDCPGSDATEPGTESIVGTWTLHTVGASSIPATITEDGETFTVTGGGATVNANGTFTWSETYGGGYSGGSDGVTGTWSAASSANTYIFDPTETSQEPNQNNATGVVSGNVMTLTIDGGGPVRTYQRQ